MKFPIYTRSKEKLLEILEKEGVTGVTIHYKLSTSDVLGFDGKEGMEIGHIYYTVKVKALTGIGRKVYATIKVGDRRGLINPVPVDNPFVLNSWFEHLEHIIESQFVLKEILEVVPDSATRILCARDADYNWTPLDPDKLLLDRQNPLLSALND